MTRITAHIYDCRIEPAAMSEWKGWQAAKRQPPVEAVRAFVRYCREELGMEPAEVVADAVDAAMVLAVTGGTVDGVTVRAAELTRCEPICLPGIYFVPAPNAAR